CRRRARPEARRLPERALRQGGRGASRAAGWGGGAGSAGPGLRRERRAAGAGARGGAAPVGAEDRSVVIQRGTICWAELAGPGAGTRYPVVVVQAEPFNRSRIPTVLAVPLTANLRLAQAPGNVRVPGHLSGLQRDAVANVA